MESLHLQPQEESSRKSQKVGKQIVRQSRVYKLDVVLLFRLDVIASMLFSLDLVTANLI